MSFFRLRLVGEDFPIGVDGEARLMGFTVTRWVEAEDHIEAASKALAMLKGEPQLAGVPAGCGAKVTYDEIVEVDRGEVPEQQGALAFF